MTPFWQLAGNPQAPAVIESATGRTWTYGELTAAADAMAAAWPRPPERGVIFLFCCNDFTSLAAYLGALRAGLPVALLPAVAHAHAGALIDAYAPALILAPPRHGPFAGHSPQPSAGSDLVAWRPDHPRPPVPVDAELALLLSTSGTTGSPKMVRLSAGNLQANAIAIAGYLGLTPAERAPTTLPMSYSYGLSVIHSHLAAGAALVLGDFPVVQRETWTALARHRATSFAGVPLSYQLLRRLRFDPRTQPGIRTYTQAGGRLDPETKRWFLGMAGDARFFSMYGQTEATARISFVPPDRLAEKPDAIGCAIPGGTLQLDPATRELIYRGPNVMLGYAESRADLAAGDTQRGVLRTGDLGRVDEDGFFYVDGRLKRFLKLAGLRTNLDELERHLETRLGGPVACDGVDEALRVHLEASVPAETVHAFLQERFGLAPSLIAIRAGSPLPRLGNGKINYAMLRHE
jgi:acyl-CoA synthetase (AMP-forming)/AMP-acid ligase II